MFFNDVHIMVYVAFGILGLIVGNILPNINKRFGTRLMNHLKEYLINRFLQNTQKTLNHIIYI